MQTQIAPTPRINGSVQKSCESVLNVYKTYDYGLFKIMSDNRTINLLHVQRLVESFHAKHLVCPIIVNERHEVIDGQHRLLASKETGLPVYFIVLKGYGINEVQVFNTNQKNWTKMDFLNMYCQEGRKPYLEFKEFMDHFPDFAIQASERILTGKLNGGRQGKIAGRRAAMKDFEEGKLVIPNLAKSYALARKIMDFKPFYPGFNRGTFVSAVLPLFSSKVYSHKEMLHKLETAKIALTDCPNIPAYRMLLEDIYNYKRQKENKVSFRYE